MWNSWLDTPTSLFNQLAKVRILGCLFTTIKQILGLYAQQTNPRSVDVWSLYHHRDVSKYLKNSKSFREINLRIIRRVGRITRGGFRLSTDNALSPSG